MTHLAVTHKLRLRRIEQTGARLYRLCPMRVFNGTPTTYRDKSGTEECAEAARNDPNGFYDRIRFAADVRSSVLLRMIPEDHPLHSLMGIQSVRAAHQFSSLEPIERR